jgi:hypothetical protein
MARLALLAGAVSLTAPDNRGQAGNKKQPEDVVLAWNLVLLDANAADHALAAPDQPGPTFTSRAFAIVSAAVYDAVNSIDHKHQPYLTELSGYQSADVRAAVSAAACHTLVELYPQQADTFGVAFEDWLSRIPSGQRRDKGVELGQRVADAILAARANDRSDAPMSYTPANAPGFHQVDPNNPNQGFHAPQWGSVEPFVLESVDDFRTTPPPDLDSAEYAEAFLELLMLGGDGSPTSPTVRTQEQTEIGLYWAYDGRPGLGTPPRLYNQIVHVIARQKRNTVSENARLIALVNLAMADAGIHCWHTKYEHEFWRPVVAIRAGDDDGNDDTDGVPGWNPLGAPLTNGPSGAPNFTPPFPAYTSGHATFGAAALWTVANFYGTDDIAFSFVSDELNGVNTDQNGVPRPLVVRRFDSLSEAIVENAQSRIYLGIHWRFDATEGAAAGTAIADYVTSHALRRKKRR